jgi:hypothetical protein
MSGSGAQNPLIAFAQGLEAWFNGKEQDVIRFAGNFLPQIGSDLEIALDDLIGIAGQAVLTQAATAASGSEKFGNAVTNVVQTVESAGKTVALQTAQMAVQQAYLTAQNQAQTATSAS